MKTLFLIPARGGSKGIPYKNIKELCGKPLIYYSIEMARKFAGDEDICVSTDDRRIIDVVHKSGLIVPFVRPAEYSTDTSSTNDVIDHALSYYKQRGILYESVCVLQPTSPLRSLDDIENTFHEYDDSTDLVVSVQESSALIRLFQDDDRGYISRICMPKEGVRRQDSEQLYEINGAIYLVRSDIVWNVGMWGTSRVRKVIMPKIRSIDIDTMEDWQMAEAILRYQEWKNR